MTKFSQCAATSNEHASNAPAMTPANPDTDTTPPGADGKSRRGCGGCGTTITIVASILLCLLAYDLAPAFQMEARKKRFREIARIDEPWSKVEPILMAEYNIGRCGFKIQRRDSLLLSHGGGFAMRFTLTKDIGRRLVELGSRELSVYTEQPITGFVLWKDGIWIIRVVQPAIRMTKASA